MPEVRKDPDGMRRLVGRRAGALLGSVLTCPDGHRQRVARPGDAHFAIECVHQAAARGALDGDARAGVHWLYLLPGDDGGTIVVEAHLDEVLHIQRARLTVAEIRRFLQVAEALSAA